MAGWLVLTHANDTYEKFETPGETFVEIAANGYPVRRSFTGEGVVSAEWFAEEPQTKGKSVAEAQAEADLAAATAAAPAEATSTTSSKK